MPSSSSSSDDSSSSNNPNFATLLTDQLNDLDEKVTSDVSDLKKKSDDTTRDLSRITRLLEQISQNPVVQAGIKINDKRLSCGGRCLMAMYIIFTFAILLTIGSVLLAVGNNKNKDDEHAFNLEITKVECHMQFHEGNMIPHEHTVTLTVCDTDCCDRTVDGYQHDAHYINFSESTVECYFKINSMCETVSLEKPLHKEKTSLLWMLVFGRIFVVISLLYLVVSINTFGNLTHLSNSVDRVVHGMMFYIIFYVLLH